MISSTYSGNQLCGGTYRTSSEVNTQCPVLKKLSKLYKESLKVYSELIDVQLEFLVDENGLTQKQVPSEFQMILPFDVLKDEYVFSYLLESLLLILIFYFEF
eukprot:TRINITY_DN38854_c0_g1_i1.p2 TRINITY_DN38854_c0_g1~~TRINITY_DN38854_c0_g1_i1.p2  ORF type:complete len:102 (-),score=9.56 TRINITY_DN38854_c0_g1_i1:77-382(-)